jgi:hypothetical protein
MQNRTELTIDDVRQIEPFATANAHGSRSARYTPVSTLDVMDSLVGNGWKIVQAEAMQVRRQHRQGFQPHLARLTRDDLRIGDEQVDILLYNAHDGSRALTFKIGVYRFVCSNGLVTGYDLAEAKFRHVGLDYDNVIDASYEVVNSAEQVTSGINQFKQIELGPVDRWAYAQAAGLTLYGENAPPAWQLLQPQRQQDTGSDLWTVLNVVQENWSKGKVPGRKEITSLGKKVGLNQSLWTLAEKTAELT